MICSWSHRIQVDMPKISTSQDWWQHRSMQQSSSQEVPGVLNEQAIMKAKRRSQTGSTDDMQLKPQDNVPKVSTNQDWWQHRSMQQSASQEGPGVLNEQAIMKAKRRSQTGSNMTSHNSVCMWMISLPKLRKLGNMCRKASMSTARV